MASLTPLRRFHKWLVIILQNNRCCRGNAGRYSTHASGEDAGYQEPTQSYGQAVDDEIRKDIVWLSYDLRRSELRIDGVVAIKRRANQEEKG